MSVRYKIDNFNYMAMIACAFFIDIAEIFLSIFIITEPVAEGFGMAGEFFILAWYWWLTKEGGGFLRNNPVSKLSATIGGFALEVAPFINDLPILTIQTWYLIHVSRKEDLADYNKEALARAKMVQEEREKQAYYARQLAAQRAQENSAVEDEALEAA
jgi:hypothetical protein